jgi:hypothetical protein
MLQKSCFRSCLYKFNLCCNSLILISLTQTIPVRAEEVNIVKSAELSNQAQTPVNPTPRRETKPPSTQPLPEQVPPAPLPAPYQLVQRKNNRVIFPKRSQLRKLT